MIETRPSDMFKVISEFALEYRTTRERVLEQRARKACHRERNKTRGKMIMDVGVSIKSHICLLNLLTEQLYWVLPVRTGFESTNQVSG